MECHMCGKTITMRLAYVVPSTDGADVVYLCKRDFYALNTAAAEAVASMAEPVMEPEPESAPKVRKAKKV